ncbi:MAG TPA: hypothetical protein VKK31_24100 [Thermoanaerobaculia bacterium]|nr:hypothetical protein [Thermoanaerobaculia bacterium]
MLRIVELVRTGAGGSLTSDAEAALRTRYYGWIIEIKKGNSTSPQDIWDTADGKDIQGKFEEIGRALAENKQGKYQFGGDDCIEACRSVESKSLCPHCPDDPTG